MPDTNNRDYLWLYVILLIAAGLRIYGLNGPLWYDEIQTIETHLRLSWGDMVQSYSMNHHYFHNILAKASMSLFGDQPWAIRLPAMLFGLGALAAMWFVARDIAGAGIAHATTLLLALSYHEIWFAQNARGYTGLALFSTLGMLLFLRGLKVPTFRTWLAYGLCLAAAVFTHLTGAFFFMAQGVLWLFVISIRAANGRLDRDMVRLPFLGFLIGGLLAICAYLPILPSLLETVSSVSDTSAIDVMQEYQNPLWTVFEAIRTGIGTAGPIVSLVAFLVLALSLLGAFSLRHSAPLFASVTFLHILLTVGLLVSVGMRIWPRFFFVDIAFLMLLIVLGVQLCCELFSRIIARDQVAAPLFALSLAAMVAISGYLAARNYAFPKQDLAGAYAFTQSVRKPDDRVYAIGYAGEVFRDHFKSDWPILFTDEDYVAAMAVPGPVILVVGFPGRSFRSVPTLERQREKELAEIAYFRGTLGDGDIVILKRN